MTGREIRRGLLLAGLAIVLVGCGSAGSAGSRSSPRPRGALIGAEGIAFDRAQLRVPSGRPFELLFDNRDEAMHNVTIYLDSPNLDSPEREPLFEGEIFSGPARRLYAVPALPPGTYLFRCDVHPQMRGTVIAG
jgi:plastocyanin